MEIATMNINPEPAPAKRSSAAFFTTVKFNADWWLQLKVLGYDPIPISGKDRPREGWPKMPNDPAAIMRWNGSGAAVRMYRSDLFVIDLDVHVAAVRDKMLHWLGEHHPEFITGCLCRHSERVTLALIGRCVTAKGTKKTARFIGEGTGPKGDLVEIFTGNSKRYVGVLGEHSRGRDYDFVGPSIIETPVARLPWFPDCEIEPMCTAFEQIMAEHGWEKVIPVIGTEAVGTKVYDLQPEMVFTLSDGETVTLADLEKAFEGYVHYAARNGGSGKITGYADLWDSGTGHRQHSNTRVIVTIGSEGLCLFDTKYEVRHRWKSCEPPKDRTELTTMLRELVKGAWS
jgi:hypothetical protein